MSLQTLLVQNLRIIESLTLELAEEVNLFYGENGAGKTSILEAIDFLSRGRSFRSRTLAPIIRNGAKQITVSGICNEGNQSIRLGIQKSPQATVLHINQTKSSSIAELARNLPVLSMHPDSHQLIQGPAKNRRNFLDWSTFHVKQKFLGQWREYNQCLRQRNQMLKQEKLHELPAWNAKLALLGEQVDSARYSIFEEINLYFATFAGKLLPEAEISLAYEQGWDKDCALLEALQKSEGKERQKKTTQKGPHRAELNIFYNFQPAATTSSRGQQKLLAASLLLAQIAHLQQHLSRKCVVLLDDIQAELDESHAAALFQALQELRCQAFLTAIEPNSALIQGWKQHQMFHVERGKCTPKT